MEAEKFEKKIAEHRNLFLSDKRIVQKDNNLTKEIPIDNIDSFSHSKKIRLKLMILGLIMVVWTLFPFLTNINILPMLGSSEILPVITQVFFQLTPGIIFVIVGYFYKKNELIIKSNTISLSEKGSGAEEFVKKLRETLYK